MLRCAGCGFGKVIYGFKGDWTKDSEDSEKKEDGGGVGGFTPVGEPFDVVSEAGAGARTRMKAKIRI